MNSPRASASLGALTSGLVRLSLRHSGGPLFLFSQSPQNIGGDCIQTHEGPSVPVLAAMAGAVLNSIPLAACAAPLPPVLFQAYYVSHALSPSVGFVSQTETNQGELAWVKNLLAVKR